MGWKFHPHVSNLRSPWFLFSRGPGPPFKGGLEPLREEINEILGSKSEDQFSNPSGWTWTPRKWNQRDLGFETWGPIFHPLFEVVSCLSDKKSVTKRKQSLQEVVQGQVASDRGWLVIISRTVCSGGDVLIRGREPYTAYSQHPAIFWQVPGYWSQATCSDKSKYLGRNLKWF
jgi:hypothetical protein